MFYGKFCVIVVSLFVSAVPLLAQWGQNPWPGTNSDPSGICRDVELDVKDSMGRSIMGAEVAIQNSAMEFTTDSQGLASIPCNTGSRAFTMIEVSAPGYFPSRVLLTPQGYSRLEVVLRKRDSVRKAAEPMVSVQELRKDVQAESRDLQMQAVGALDRNDYNAAEKLFLEAFNLTPSMVSIPNNLGIVELRRKDLNAAGSWFEKAMAIAPYRADVLGNLGIVRWMQQRDDESYKLLIQASAMGYETGPGNYIIGMVSLRKGEIKEAAKRLKKVPEGPFPYRDLFLSLALRNLGKTKDADRAFSGFLKRTRVPLALNTLQN